MSVDDAFRKMMNAQAYGSVPEGGGGANPAPAQGASGAREEAPSVPAPPPASPPVEPLDLGRVRTVERFARTALDPRSQIAEEYRKMRTRIMALHLEQPSILLTSCHHNEGKTSTAMNLAFSMSNWRDRKILLADFDLRRPRIRRFMGVGRQSPGFPEILAGEADVEEGLVYSQKDNLYFLGPNEECPQASEYLETEHVIRMITRLHSTFDFVIFDSAPCTSTSDPAVMGNLVGGVLLVVRCLHTQRESIQHAINSLSEVGVPTVGVVLSFVRYFLPRPLYRYQYYHGYYYYRGDEDDEGRMRA